MGEKNSFCLASRLENYFHPVALVEIVHLVFSLVIFVQFLLNALVSHIPFLEMFLYIVWFICGGTTLVTTVGTVFMPSLATSLCFRKLQAVLTAAESFVVSVYAMLVHLVLASESKISFQKSIIALHPESNKTSSMILDKASYYYSPQTHFDRTLDDAIRASWIAVSLQVIIIILRILEMHFYGLTKKLCHPDILCDDDTNNLCEEKPLKYKLVSGSTKDNTKSPPASLHFDTKANPFDFHPSFYEDEISNEFVYLSPISQDGSLYESLPLKETNGQGYRRQKNYGEDLSSSTSILMTQDSKAAKLVTRVTKAQVHFSNDVEILNSSLDQHKHKNITAL